MLRGTAHKTSLVLNDIYLPYRYMCVYLMNKINNFNFSSLCTIEQQMTAAGVALLIIIWLVIEETIQHAPYMVYVIV